MSTTDMPPPPPAGAPTSVLALMRTQDGRPPEPWEVQAEPPHPQLRSKLLATAPKRPGDIDSKGYVITWPDLSTWPDPPPEWPVCDDCGLVHFVKHNKATVGAIQTCVAHTQLGLPCRHPKAHGTSVCWRHGGGKKQAGGRASRRKRLADEGAKKSLARVKVKPLGNPIDHLAELAAESIALKQHFANTVAQLRDQYRFTDDKGAEQLDARVALYERSMDRSAKFLSDLVKIGFEEKRLALEEARARHVRTFIIGVLAGLGHDPNAPEVRAQIEQWATVLDGEAAPEIIEARLVDDDDE